MTERRLKKFRTVLSRRRFDLTVVLENVHDPHNVSAILRSADAAGVARVQLIYTKEVFPKMGTKLGKKSSASAMKWVLRRPFPSVDACYAQLRAEGFAIYATRLDGSRSASLYELDLTRKTALVFGNEHAGVSDEAAAGADGNFVIPMGGMIESLNVSVACAVALFEAVRQRSAGKGRHDKLDAQLMKALRQEWLAPLRRRGLR